jgi:hypothetical protein
MARKESWSLLIALGATLILAGCGGSQSATEPDGAALQSGLLRSSQSSAEIARLHRLGFVAGISEQLTSANNQNRYGLTDAEQFSSAKSAEAEVAHSTVVNGPWTVFSVPGVPGARGFEESAAGEGGRNIAFSHGNFVYLIGSGWQATAANGVPRATMVAVARKLYQRVSG